MSLRLSGLGSVCVQIGSSAAFGGLFSLRAGRQRPWRRSQIVRRPPSAAPRESFAPLPLHVVRCSFPPLASLAQFLAALVAACTSARPISPPGRPSAMRPPPCVSPFVSAPRPSSPRDASCRLSISLVRRTPTSLRDSFAGRRLTSTCTSLPPPPPWWPPLGGCLPITSRGAPPVAPQPRVAPFVSFASPSCGCRPVRRPAALLVYHYSLTHLHRPVRATRCFVWVPLPTRLPPAAADASILADRSVRPAPSSRPVRVSIRCSSSPFAHPRRSPVAVTNVWRHQ